MSHRITIIQGHPDPDAHHYGHALARAYAEGAQAAGHELREIRVAELDFPLLRTKEDWEHGTPPEAIREAQQDIAWADHLLILYPLWMGGMPALLKAFLEQALRPGFAIQPESNGMWHKLLKGRSARVVVTMGMPAPIYRWFYRAHTLRNLERNILDATGIKPVRSTLVGMVEDSPRQREKWLGKLRALGHDAR